MSITVDLPNVRVEISPTFTTGDGRPHYDLRELDKAVAMIHAALAASETEVAAASR